jgi:lipoic acid synthetase
LKPRWLKVRFPSDEATAAVSSLVARQKLQTICRNARCPNIGECWAEKTATFLLLGNTCTRACAFCAVAKGRPSAPDPGEPGRVAEAAEALGLRYVVVTSVTRDDLPDGGAGHFAATIAALREKIPGARVEVLIPDFAGSPRALEMVIDAGPDVLNHNLETTETTYPRINRPPEFYRRSLDVLRRAKDRGATTKSGLMIGLGETEPEIKRALADLREAGCGLLTLGQYLQPSRAHAPVERYYSPEEFQRWRAFALGLGFDGVEAGPLVRSSYHAHRLFAGDDPSRAPKDPSCAT